MAHATPTVTGGGLALAGLSMIGNGTFGMFPKLCKTQPDPIVFNACLAGGILVSSLLALPFLGLVAEDWPLGWSWPGALAGVLLVISTMFSFIAISLSGLATAQATWSCAAIFVSFLWGAAGPKRGGAGPGAPMRSAPLSALSVMLLVVGVTVINLSDRLSCGGRGCCLRKTHLLVEDGPTDGDAPPGSVRKSFFGLLAAMVVGLCGGSILVPMSFASPELQGLPLLLPMGVAAGVSGLVVLLGYWACYLKKPLSLRSGSELRQELRCEVVFNGMISGAFWNLGNICQIIAMNYRHMPYGVSYPILQCALVVACFWGVCIFKEATGAQQIRTLVGGVFLVVCGVVLLGSYGPGS